MKKLITIITTVLFALSSLAAADDLEILYGETDIYYLMDANDEWNTYLDSHFDLLNTSDRDIEIATTFIIDNLYDGHLLSFCYELCYNVPKSGVFNIPDNIILPPGKTVKDVLQGTDIKITIETQEYPNPRTPGDGSFKVRFCENFTDNCQTLHLNYKFFLGQVSEEPVLAAYEDELYLETLGYNSVKRKGTITNSGKDTLIITASSLTGKDAASFSIIDDTEFPIILERGYSHSFDIMFNPDKNDVVENPYIADLKFESNAENNSTFAIQLMGNLHFSIADEILKSLKVYPSPANNILNVEMDSFKANSFIQIYDVTGNMLIEQKLNKSNQISIEKLSVGSYFYKIKNGLDYSDAISFVVVR